ncbi:TIGR03620 family F420-dependent LLM class oxidoreductase [Streptomyces sp. MMS24-I2-30]|uniref:TIGR03620 family F420-dependent LLM class oxidoreductase n=1 Tax=Streptomyces sp. MMS24-I2-30 TaxID=3351564 RepID=UPI003896B5D6
MGSVGIWTGVLDALPLPEAREVVADLDEQGWGSLWFGEAFGREALTAAQVYLAAGRRMVVGTSIASIYGRDAVAAAAAARTLHAMYPGRFVLGLGVSHAPLVEGMRGHNYGRPVAAMSAYLDALDAAPAGVPGEDRLPPRVLAALGPRMLGLSRDRADGANPYLVLPEHTAMARETLGGKPGNGPLLVVEQAAVLDPDPQVWQSRAHEHLEIYTGLPNYRTSWLRQGFGEADFTRGGSPRLAEAMVPRGLEATVRRIHEHLAAGADTVCVQVLGPDLVTPPRADWARLAEALALRG